MLFFSQVRAKTVMGLVGALHELSSLRPDRGCQCELVSPSILSRSLLGSCLRTKGVAMYSAGTVDFKERHDCKDCCLLYCNAALTGTMSALYSTAMRVTGVRPSKRRLYHDCNMYSSHQVSYDTECGPEAAETTTEIGRAHV